MQHFYCLGFHNREAKYNSTICTLWHKRAAIPSGVSPASASPLDLQTEQCFSQPALENKRTCSCHEAGLLCLMILTLIQIQARMGHYGQRCMLVLLTLLKFQRRLLLKCLTLSCLRQSSTEKCSTLILLYNGQ